MWVARNPPTTPPARFSHALAHDTGRNRTLLFGGMRGTSLLGDTWEWSGSTWMQALPANAAGLTVTNAARCRIGL